MKKYLLLSLLCAIGIFAFAPKPNAFLKELQTKLWAYGQTYNEETVYVMTDKTIYKPSETIWYSVFVNEQTGLQASNISDVLYIDLIDPKGNKAQTTKHALVNGRVAGNFVLNDVVGGLYRIKAYTLWMGNFGEQTHFSKDIQVQKVITPRLLLKLDYQKKAYGPNDEVVADLKITDLANKKVHQANVKVKVSIQGKVVQEFEVSNTEGEAQIKFQLPAKLHSSDALLQVLVSDRGTEESISRSVPIVLNKIALNFYPEGGYSLVNMDAKVAFEALNEFGKGADVSGEIVDQDHKRVATFESFHFGMGAFRFTPKADRQYFARILKPEGIDSLVALPSALSAGVSMNLIQQTAEECVWNVFTTDKISASMVAHIHGVWQAGIELDLKKGANTVRINTSEMPMGIAVFSLMVGNKTANLSSKTIDKSPWDKIAERLVFVNRTLDLRINIKTNKEFYLPGEQVKVSISTTNKKGDAQSASLAVSVVDEQLLTMADDKQDNILSHLFLTSELKGTIHEPSFYFNPKEKKSEEAMDYLMLIHGWRRFSWSDVLAAEDRQLTLPENNSCVVGEIFNEKTQEPVMAEVSLVEINGTQRVQTITTNASGQFTFFGIDSQTSFYLMTAKPNNIRTINRPKTSTFKPKDVIALKNKQDAEALEALEVVAVADGVDAPLPPVVVVEEVAKEEAMPFGMVEKRRANAEAIFEDPFANQQQNLDEVVIVGYGAQRKKDVTGSVVTIYRDDLLFQGAMAGVQVVPPNANPGANANIQIRGTNSISNNSPLYIIDGIPTSGDNDFLQHINPNAIASITVLKDAASTAIYGVRAANGVIMITTKKGGDFMVDNNRSKPHPDLCNVLYFPVFAEKKFIQEYQTQRPRSGGIRNNFATTVYWKGIVNTDNKGEASLSFYNNDATSSFRITAEGTGGGLIGSTQMQYATQMPLSIDVKLPNYLGFADTLRIPVMVKNNSKDPLMAVVTINLPSGLELLAVEDASTKAIVAQNIERRKRGDVEQVFGIGNQSEISIAPDRVETIWFKVTSRSEMGNFPIQIQLKGYANDQASSSAPLFTDQVAHQINVYPIGFPQSAAVSGRNTDLQAQFTITPYEKGSLTGLIQLHLNSLDDLMDGVAALIREPYGCFEQTSSTNYPNIYALQLLNAMGGKESDKTKALSALKSGYKRLASFESSGGGFEWFGGPKGHVGLSAYGLVQFEDMKSVMSGIDTEQVKRTRAFILSKMKPDGTFTHHGGLDQFGRSPDIVSDAYVCYALSVAGEKSIDKSYNACLKEAESSKDFYRLALMANTAYHLNKMDDYTRLIQTYFVPQSKKGDYDASNVQFSIVSGSTRYTEAVAFWTLALIKNFGTYGAEIESNINYIITKRGSYGFGSTQATALCLNALTQYAIQTKNSDTNPDGVAVFKVNSKTVELPYSKQKMTNPSNSNFVSDLKVGVNHVDVKLDQAVPYSVVVRWNALTPNNSEKCPLSISTTLSDSEMKVNETNRLVIKLQNKTKLERSMSMAVVGIPAGLSLQPWQLKELQEKGVFDFYEILDNRLAIYYRGMGPNEKREINLDLKADIPGKYFGSASSAYLYYEQENRSWVKGLEVMIGD